MTIRFVSPRFWPNFQSLGSLLSQVYSYGQQYVSVQGNLQYPAMVPIILQYTCHSKICYSSQSVRLKDRSFQERSGYLHWPEVYRALPSEVNFHGSKSGPLVLLGGGAPLTKPYLFMLLHSVGFDLSKFVSHSFRIIAASTAVERGPDNSVIKVLGQWNSNGCCCSWTCSLLQSTVVGQFQAYTILGSVFSCIFELAGWWSIILFACSYKKLLQQV